MPHTVKAISPLVGQILIESATRHSQGEITEFYLFYNHPTFRERFMRPSVNDYYRWMKTGVVGWSNIPGQQKICLRLWVTAIRS